MHVRIDSNAKEFGDFVDRATRKQLPFAVALALTRVAQRAQARVRADLSKHFKVRSTWLSRGILITPASKYDWPNIKSEVGSRDEFMVLQEEGGTKRPKKSKDLAIPSENVRTGAGGKIPLGSRPKRLLAKRKYFVAKLTQGRSAGKFAILRRVEAGRYPLQVLYIFRGSGQVKPRFHFRETVVGVVRKHFAGELTKAFDSALQPKSSEKKAHGH